MTDIEKEVTIHDGDQPLMGWEDFKSIANHPLVEEAIKNFLNDSTEDNAVCMVRDIAKEFYTRVLALPRKEDPSTIRWLATNEKGESVSISSRSTSDPLRDTQIMDSALELTQAIKRGVQITPEEFFSLVTGIKIPALSNATEADFPALYKFYGANSLAELCVKQCNHITRLQRKVQSTELVRPLRTVVREG